MKLTQTRTYAELVVSADCYEEIMHLLQEAGYDHAFHTEHPGKVLIDMHGIALSRNPAPSTLIPATNEVSPGDDRYILHWVQDASGNTNVWAWGAERRDWHWYDPKLYDGNGDADGYSGSHLATGAQDAYTQGYRYICPAICPFFAKASTD